MFLCDEKCTSPPSRVVLQLQYPDAQIGPTVNGGESIILKGFIDNVCDELGAGLRLGFETNVLNVAQSVEIGAGSAPILDVAERVSACWLNGVLPDFKKYGQPTSSWNICVKIGEPAKWFGHSLESGDVVVWYA